MARLKWSKGGKLRSGEYEEKYDPGTVMNNGRVVPVARADGLAVRAALAEREWLAGRAKKRKQQKARRRAKNKPPTRAEQTRLKMILQQLSIGKNL